MCIRSNASSKGKEKKQILQIKNNNLPTPPAGIRKIHVNADIFYLQKLALPVFRRLNLRTIRHVGHIVLVIEILIKHDEIGVGARKATNTVI